MKDIDDTDVRLIYGQPKCKNLNTYDMEENQTIFNKNGIIHIGTEFYNYKNSCIYYSMKTEEGSNRTIYSTHVQICDQVGRFALEDLIQLIDFKIIPGILIMSTILLGVLVIFDMIYNQDKLFSALRICVVVMYLIVNGVLCIVKFQVDVEKKFPNLCVAEAIVIQFSYLSAICWLNTMCFDVWTKFRKMRVNTASRRKSHHQRKRVSGFTNSMFKYYAIYSLGIPFIVSSVTALIHFLPEELTTNVILPFKVLKREQFIEERNIEELIKGAKARCFFNDNLSTLLYFFVLTGPMLLMNLVLFLLFTWSLCCGIWSNSSSDMALDRQRRNFKRILIMFFTLGLPWICDLIGFILMWLGEVHDTTLYVIKTGLNVITASQGILMFCSIFLFDSSMRKKCSCTHQSEESKIQKSIQMSVRKKSGKKKDSQPEHPFSSKKVNHKRQTPVMISYKRKRFE